MAVLLLRKPRARSCPGVRRAVLLVALVLIAGLAPIVLGSSPAVASKTAPGTWSVRKEYPVGLSVLVGISCPTASDCWAVGKNSIGYGSVLATSDGGNSWVTEKLPYGVGSLNAISCVDAAHCWAVGFSWINGPLVIRTVDGGQRWISEKVPRNRAASLLGISCVSTTQCWAVGGSFENGVGGLILATTDGGRTWITQSFPTADGNPTAISCVNALQCRAVVYGSVGFLFTNDGGGTWVGTASAGILTSISCPSTSDCLAAGYTPQQNPLIEATTDGGATWTAQTLPSEVQTIYTVFCSNTSDCWAGGYNNDGPTLVATTNGGSTWALESLPSLVVQVVAISCVGASDCVALSDAVTVVTLNTTDGGATWAASALQDTDPFVFSGISCPSTSQCWAVGTDSSTTSGVVVDTTDSGQTWTTQDLPGTFAVLQGISCPSTSTCFAVGESLDLSGFVVSTTDAGSSWTAPNYMYGGTLRGISCPNTSDCWAVGDASGDERGATAAYATVDGGATWTSQRLPSQFQDSGAISCTDSADCVTTGGVTTALTTDGGAMWTPGLVPQPSLPLLRAISCVGTDCVVVGNFSDQYGRSRFGGAASSSTQGNVWKEDHLRARTLALSAISCPTKSTCWAMGGEPYVSNRAVALITHDGGAKWSRRQLPKGVANISAVSCPTASTCWAVGITSRGAVILSLGSEPASPIKRITKHRRGSRH